ncbi:MAG: hypothetical protein HY318_11590 [Armatimonadetes bacterium]|nr:hypothetical protein [Armatimonadota bacterium]
MGNRLQAILLSAMLIGGQLPGVRCQSETAGKDPFRDWHYCSPLSLTCQASDITVEVATDFGKLLRDSGISGTFDPKSVRVAELKSNEGSPVEIPSIYVPTPSSSQEGGQRGRVRFRVRHGTSSRSYRIYFDLVENGEKPVVNYGDACSELTFVDNGGFERADKEGKTPESWELPKRAGGFLDTSQVHTGSRSIRLHAADKGQVASFGIPGMGALRVEPGERYSVRFWTRGQDLTDRGLIVSVYWYDVSKRYLSHEKLKEVSGPSWEWRLFDQNLTVPPEAQEARIFVSSYAAHGYLWIDDVSIAPLALPELKALRTVAPEEPARAEPEVPK